MMDHPAGSSKVGNRDIEAEMRNRDKFSLIIVLIILWGLAGCMSPPQTSQPRTFTTSDLLIDPNLLPNNWEVISGPTNETPEYIALRNNLGGSDIQFGKLNSSVEQTIVVFASERDAAKSYQDHDYTRNTFGPFATTWESLHGWVYKSPMASQYRLVCARKKNAIKTGEMCVIEAQYNEFLSILIYNTSEENQAFEELEALAKAVDDQFKRYTSQ